MKKILITGGAGYLGSILSKKLIDKGYQIRCFDRLYFTDEPIKNLFKNKNFGLIKGNIVNLDSFPHLLDGIDAVIHLAGLANDPTAELDSKLTEIVNFESSYKLAKLAKSKGVKRFIFASSCSVYGKGLVDIITEDSPLNPVSVYAESKAKAERKILKLADAYFHPVCLRQATLFGPSARMRFDLAINLMVMHALTKGKIFIWGGGDQWRPFLHVEDASEAFICCLSVPFKKISGKIYNLGSTKDNYTILELANIIKRKIKGVKLDIVPDNSDKRSYRVSFNKIEKALGWKPKKSLKAGIDGIIDFVKARIKKGFDDPVYYNIKTMQKFAQTPAIANGDPVRPDFLPFCLPSIGKEEEGEVVDTLRSGWLTTGPRTQKFEQMLKNYIGCKYGICVSSCTAALHLSLVVLGIKEGDEVITSPITWPATANVIVHLGATPVFADVDKETLNIDPKEIESKITKRTKAIIPVHMAGQPCRMDEIKRIAKKHKLHIIEDAAHAIGAKYKGKKIGTLSDFTCFSFYPIKNITTGEGGLVATNNDKWAEKIRIYSLHGVSKDAWKRYSNKAKGYHEVIFPGFKYNMSDIQAALGLHQLPKLEEFIRQREHIVRQYNNVFSETPEITLIKHSSSIKHAHHLYIIALNTEKLNITRDDFVEAMRQENIGTGIHFKSLHIQAYYRKAFKFKKSDFPNASYFSDRILSLPLYPDMTQYDVDTVTKAVKKLINYYKK